MQKKSTKDVSLDPIGTIFTEEETNKLIEENIIETKDELY